MSEKRNNNIARYFKGDKEKFVEWLNADNHANEVKNTICFIHPQDSTDPDKGWIYTKGVFFQTGLTKTEFIGSDYIKIDGNIISIKDDMILLNDYDATKLDSDYKDEALVTAKFLKDLINHKEEFELLNN